MRQNKYSDTKIINFPEKIQSFRDEIISAPIYVRVKPTNRCPMNCWWCSYGSGENRTMDNQTGMHQDIIHRDEIPSQKLMEILEDFHYMGVRAVTYSGGGEPLMHPAIVEVMQRTLWYGIDLSIITNGQMLANRRAEVLGLARWVRVSIDYTTAQQMVASRNVPEHHFAKIIQNLENFAKIKQPTCDLGVNYIITKDNYRGLAEFARLLKGCGVNNVRFSPVWLPNLVEYHTPIMENVLSELALAGELVDDNFTLNTTYNIASSTHSPIRGYNKCYTMQTVPVIGADQIVYSCHNKAYDKTGAIGSIKDRRFREFWFSDDAKKVFDGLDPDKVCQHQCAAHNKNILINSLVESSHDNFV